MTRRFGLGNFFDSSDEPTFGIMSDLIHANFLPVHNVAVTSPSATMGNAGATDNPATDEDSFPLATVSSSASSSTSSVTNAAKPVATIAQLADYLVNGFWTYAGTNGHHWASSTITYNISGLTAAEQFLAQSALQAWHEVANINFVQTSGAANISFSHNGAMTASTGASWDGTGAMTSAVIDISSDWVTSDGGAYDGKTGIDSYAYQTYIHEIGHALGLGHQGPYNGSATYSTNAIYADDTWQYSVMSYFAQNNYGGSYRYVVTPQMADIYAVGQIYGAASTRVGDTIYGFHSTAGSIFDFSAYSQAPALTIYDSGGSDTLDCSGYSVAQTIDLHPGSFSSVGGLTNNIGISTNTVVETAIGGGGNDTIYANDQGCTLVGGAGNDMLIGGAGSDRLTGSPGADRMTGGGGADTFVFAQSDSAAATGQHDLVTDFVTGIDHIDLSGIDAISSTLAYDPFNFIGASAFDGTAGELDYFFSSSLGVTILQGDTNGDRVADFAIDLTGNIALSIGDLIGAIGFPTVIEAVGSTSLVRIAGNYFLDPVGGGTGPELKFGGAAVVAGQFGGWTPIGAEAVGSGYQIAWKVQGTDQYTVWNTDSSGNYVGNAVGVVSGGSVDLESLETNFQQDLNGDGLIGVYTNTIESSGSTILMQIGSSYFLNPVGGGTGPTLKFGGAVVAAGQFGGWTPIGAEITGSGYEIAWKVQGTDQYTVWNADSSGNYVGQATGLVSGNSTDLETLETSFQQDLNGDGTIGIPATVIESSGSTSLAQIGPNYFLNPVGGATGPELKFGGAVVVAGQFGGWTPIGAEAAGSGYQVAWKVQGMDQYTVWATDSSGNYVGQVTDVVAGNSTALESLETSFQQDLNGDGIIGIPSTVIEASGSTSLVQIGPNYFLNPVGGGTGPELMFGGAVVVAGQFGSWAPIGAEVTGSGYEVAWKVQGMDQYTVWNIDSSGNYVGQATGLVSGNNTDLKTLETNFQQDLNGDGTLSAATLATTGLATTSLATTSLAAAESASAPAGPSHFESTTLTLGTPSTYGGLVVDFDRDGTLAGQDQIDLRGINYSSIHSSFDSSTGTLAVTDGSTAASLQFLGHYSADNFNFADDGNGGTIVYGAMAAGQAATAQNHLTGAGSTLASLAGNHDVFVFAPDFGQVTITNFVPATDTIQFARSVFPNVNAVLAALHDDGAGNAVITDAAHDAITLQHVTTAQLLAHQSDFHIA